MSRSANDEQSATDRGWNEARNELFHMIAEGRSFSGRERNCCFLNTHQERFATISAVSGLDFPDDARAIAVTDWDRDGDQDLWISNRNAPRLRLMRNETATSNHYLSLRLTGNGTTTNRDAIGARVSVYLAATDGVQPPVLTQTLRAGEGFLAQSSKWIHFGLGPSTDVERVTVRWPGGPLQTWDGIQVDQRYQLRQTEAIAQRVDTTPATAIAAGASPLPPESRAARVPLETRLPMPTITYTDASGKRQQDRFDDGAPRLVNLWASWCAPCVQEMAELGEGAERIRATGLRVVSLSVDLIGDRPTTESEVRQLIERLDYPFAWGHLSADEMDRLQGLNNETFFLKRPLPLPSSFLIDAQGNLAAIYRGPVTVDQILSDTKLSANNYSELAAQAARFPGRSIARPRVREVARRSAELKRRRVAAWLKSIGDLPGAAEQLVALARAEPQSAAAQRAVASHYLETQQMDAALQWAESALQRDAQSGRTHNLLGRIHSQRRDLANAERHFRESLRLNSQLAGPHNNLGIILAMKGQMAEAAREFQRAVELDENFAEAHTNLGNVYANQDPQRAFHHFRRAIEIDPERIDAYNNLGTLYGRQGNIKKAIELYRHALSINPDHPQTRQLLERALQFQ